MANYRLGTPTAVDGLVQTGTSSFTNIIVSGSATFNSNIIVDGYTIDLSAGATTSQVLQYNGTKFVAATSSGLAIGNTVTGGTTGSVLFVGSSSLLQQNNANLFWDDTNNRLGIGTAATPLFPLHVQSNAAAAAYIKSTNTAGTGIALSIDSVTSTFGAAGIAFSEAGTLQGIINNWNAGDNFGSSGYYNGMNFSAESGRFLHFKIGTTRISSITSTGVNIHSGTLAASTIDSYGAGSITLGHTGSNLNNNFANIQFGNTENHDLFVLQSASSTVGRDLNFKAGFGGNASGATAGFGGSLSINGGNAGNGDATFAAGQAGSVFINGGNAGANNGGGGNVGGSITLTGGTSSSASGSTPGVIGPGVTIYAGNGGDGTASQLGGVGGALGLLGGAAGANNGAGNRDGGNVNIQGGQGNAVGFDGSISIGTTFSGDISIGTSSRTNNITMAVPENNSVRITGPVASGGDTTVNSPTLNMRGWYWDGSPQIAEMTIRTEVLNTLGDKRLKLASAYVDAYGDFTSERGIIIRGQGAGATGYLQFLDGTNVGVSLNDSSNIRANSNNNWHLEVSEDQGAYIELGKGVHRRSNASNFQITSAATPTDVVSHSPEVHGNFVVYVFYRVATATTDVEINVTWNDNAGASTSVIVPPATSTAVGTYNTAPVYVNAVTGTPIKVTATAGTANNLFVSASIVGIN